MSNILEYGENRKKCQKFTPNQLAEVMLDLAGYKSNLKGKKFLENSFGEGVILKKAVVRYIEDCKNNGFSKKEILTGLKEDFYGVELDSFLFNQLKKELNSILKKYDMQDVEWNLYNKDTLKLAFDIKFDYIIGNPPYLSYKMIDEENRKYIRKRYDTCSKGKFDYCYAFIDMAIDLLGEKGKLVQLIPSNIYKNVFASKLRTKMLNHITHIIDYPGQSLFSKTLTSSSVFLYDKENNNEYIDYVNDTNHTKKTLNKNNLQNKWIFDDLKEECGIENNRRYVRFGDVFHASVVIATLYNKAFLLSRKQIEASKLELEIIRPTVSPRTMKKNKDEYIIFPYIYTKDHYLRFSEKDFEINFPYITKHLRQYEKQLKNRKKDKNAKWFEYGRSQALAHLNQKKLLLSTVITDSVKVSRLKENVIPYSGIFITVKNIEYSLEDAIQILTSKEFYNYAQNIGINISGKSIRITCKDINNFHFKWR